MKHKLYKQISIFSLLILCFANSQSLAERILVEDKKTLEVGREAAQKFFTKTKVSPSPSSSRTLSLHAGGYINSKSYDWGKSGVSERTGYQTLGVTYKIGEWSRAMDLSMRIDYLQYAFLNKNPIKLSVLPMLTFPDAASNFPIYFGGGLGAGVFLTQLERESNISLDYQLIFGLRLQDIWGHSGFFIESGIKDHVHLLSDGQFTGQFLVAGAVFSL